MPFHVGGKSFLHRHSMLEHLKAHTQEKPFSCDQSDCKMGFKSKGELRAHEKTHSEERPFNCECGKSFKAMCYLKKHQ